MSSCDFHLCIIIGMPFCIRLLNFIQIGPSVTELWRHSDHQDGGRQPCWIFRQTTHKVQMRVSGRFWSFDWIVVSEILLFLCREVLAWNCLFTWLYPLRMSRIKGWSTSGVKTDLKFWFVGVDLLIQHPICRGVAGRIRCVFWRSPTC